ncbi:hypothetical protein [Parasphingopyxis lamellibrachiae]|uniref:Uncharacterized protein n=1 Tax=Parasphingopyxis lamellibrachiae TaxID=680125 RepID=A0A3D9FIT4_9SPHN|nr:hypothetical protein [Parasphingopyxis lamellibrachiae]RED17492.1 hypothetical protein DFR46_2539 [Parasphingopyxis lamellibrachiae]
MDVEIRRLMASAIQNANIEDPIIEPGVTRDNHYKNSEETAHLVDRICSALDGAGYKIVKK